MSPAQYADRTGLSLNHVYKLIRANKLPATKIDGKLRYELADDVQQIKAKPGPKPKSV